MNRIGLACLLLTVAALGGCTTVQPWERDILARRSMQLNTHPHIAAADDHIYFSKEGSSGGRTFDGGGCGSFQDRRLDRWALPGRGRPRAISIASARRLTLPRRSILKQPTTSATRSMRR